ncbi:MAG: DUF1292 domain-containing protein [Bacilli bacterium]|nr:DUF1292 domain-containing protein [Bacilli bacterium]
MDDKLKMIDKDGNEKEYEILLAFYWTKTNKHYVVYTDNTEDENGLSIYASIYYPNDNTKLDKIETEEEWNEIEYRLNNTSLLDQGEE